MQETFHPQKVCHDLGNGLSDQQSPDLEISEGKSGFQISKSFANSAPASFDTYQKSDSHLFPVMRKS